MKYSIWQLKISISLQFFCFLVDFKMNCNRKECPLSSPAVALPRQNNQFTEAISVIYNFVNELPDATCQTTLCSVQSPA